MSDQDLRRWRRRTRAGDPPQDLIDELRRTATMAARRGDLPPTFAPYGTWDEEAGEELCASWTADVLLGRGQLQVLLDRAYSLLAFRSLAARSLRQHVVDLQDRSQARNLYRRLVSLLEEDDSFAAIGGASDPRNRWYYLRELTENPPPWDGGDRALASYAWALGDFTVIRYRASSRKLSPVLDEAELGRFAQGLMEVTGHAMSAAVINRALLARFGLADSETVELEEGKAVPPAPDRTEDQALLGETARWIVQELTDRQREVLRLSGEVGISQIAERLHCSNATIFNEQRRIGALIDRFSADPEERDRLLKFAVDLVYRDIDE